MPRIAVLDEDRDFMRRTAPHTAVGSLSAAAVEDVTVRLRDVVLQYAGRCFLDTDGVTRDATRMMTIMDSWRPHRSDRQAGVRRNSAFDPRLPVVVVAGSQICHPPGTTHPGQPALLFTIVPRDTGSTACEPEASRSLVESRPPAAAVSHPTTPSSG